MGKEIKTLKDLVLSVEETLNIPENNHVVAVFEDNEHDEIVGWLVVENGVEADYPVYTTKELIEKYGRRN